MRDGYGHFFLEYDNERNPRKAILIPAHRFVLQLVHGRDLTDEEKSDHLCRNVLCCNPLHLEVVSNQENVVRGLLGELRDFNPSEEMLTRFWSKVWKPNVTDCWLWEGATNPAGYGTFRSGRAFYNAHRFSVMIREGRRLSRSEQVDHLCRVKLCCNPGHLELVSSSVNTLRGYAAHPPLEF
jgi:hypothetical protein